MSAGRAAVRAFVPNVMDRSRFPAHVEFIDTAADAAGASLVVVDLDRIDDPTGFVASGAATIGFGSHVEADRLDAARKAGIDDVMARSVFFRRLPELLLNDRETTEEPER